MTRINASIMEEMGSTFRSFKDFIIKKIVKKNNPDFNDENVLTEL